MKVVVDGIIYSMAAYGIPNVFREILPRMCDLEPALQVKLFLRKTLQQQPPGHSNIIPCWIPRIERYLRPRKFWQQWDSKARQFIQQFYIDSGKKQIWHSTYYTSPWQWKGKRVATVHDLITEKFAASFFQTSSIRFRQEKGCSKREADAIICVSQTTAQDLQEWYRIDPSRVRVIYNGVSDVFRLIDSSVELVDPQIHDPFLLYVGARYHEYKNFDGLLFAYSHWRLRSDIPLVVVGKPWSKDEIRQLTELGLVESVHLLTNCSDQRLCLLYNSATALIYPSKYEGFGLPLIEAMRCGCPIIASRILSSIEVAGEIPIFFDLDEPDSMLAAFDQALREGRDSLRTQAGLAHANLFSWDRASRQTLEVYRSLSA